MEKLTLDAKYHSSIEVGEVRFSIYNRGCDWCERCEVVVNNHESDKYCVLRLSGGYEIVPSCSNRSFDANSSIQTINFEIHDMSNMTVQDVIDSVRGLIPGEVLDLIDEVKQHNSN